MNDIMQFLDSTLKPVVLVFTVSNLAAMGLQVRLPAALAKPLLITILLPLVIAAAIRHFADGVATRLFKPVKALAMISTLACRKVPLIRFGRAMKRVDG